MSNDAEHPHPMNIARGHQDAAQNPPVTELSEEQSWELLKQARFARLATRDGDEIDITPLNIVADGERIYFRSAKGTKVLHLQLNPHVAVEIDRTSGAEAHSVVVRGTAAMVTDPDLIAHVEELGLRPWLDTEKIEVVEITPTRITGRAFRLGR
ncbi:pyridoxamine 5'-phosphate oxidase family protein [Kocuria sp.]|uniref:pyridoxamine 5'-phosphate oxidase family protein n=1 Tax=Kocuria sp. TaxID=1871328 RepID=UPI0026DBC65A|nr:pyridoxamine 5'-phosphate oxidase family protein [Kocuria sp.]MDO4918306.1 pyridoxamine 5'-phosphate oxidase family protein [Kocuria sp.]